MNVILLNHFCKEFNITQGGKGAATSGTLQRFLTVDSDIKECISFQHDLDTIIEKKTVTRDLKDILKKYNF